MSSLESVCSAKTTLNAELKRMLADMANAVRAELYSMKKDLGTNPGHRVPLRDAMRIRVEDMERLLSRLTQPDPKDKDG